MADGEPPKAFNVESLPAHTFVCINKINADNLSAKDLNGKSDPFIRCGWTAAKTANDITHLSTEKLKKADRSLGNCFYQSPTTKNTLTFKLNLGAEPPFNRLDVPAGANLQVEVWDKDWHSSSEWMGVVVFNFNDAVQKIMTEVGQGARSWDKFYEKIRYGVPVKYQIEPGPNVKAEKVSGVLEVELIFSPQWLKVVEAECKK